LAVACALGYVDFRHGNRDWRKNFPLLAKWYKDIAERPSLRATEPQG